MAEMIHVRGLKEFQGALRDIEKTLGPELRKGLNEVVEVVLGDARAKVPSRTGKARASMKAGSSQRAAIIKVGGSKAPYYPWLDFGGRVGKSKSVKRPFIPEGRYVYPTLKSNRQRTEEKLFEVIERLAEQAGLKSG